jgi:hypothetical protein
MLTSTGSAAGVEATATAAPQTATVPVAAPPTPPSSGGGGTTTTTTTTTETAPPTTPSGPPPLPPPPPGEANVVPISGTVLVNGQPLQQGQALPLNTPIDTTNGIVQITTLNAAGQEQSLFAFGGVFVIRQAAPGAVTELVLIGGKEDICAAKKSKRHVAAKAPKAKRSKKVIRSLWGQGTGSFRTRGKYSSATVRGTFWLTADRCDGTLTRVEEGTVTVRDFVKKKTIIVTAGNSYLAAAS